MYSNIVATGEYVWAPSSGVLGGNDVDLDISNVNIDGVDLDEGSGDSEEDGILNLENDMSQMVGGVNMSSSSNSKSNGKRKERDHSEVRGRKKKIFGIGVQLLSMLDQLLEIMSTRSDFTSLHMDRQGCSIPEVMAELHSIPGVSIDDDFYDFATEYLSLRRKREMWSSMGGLEEKLKWLKRMYARSNRA
ncbi:hypothetical protein Peur_056107 [Populus x canadensis]